MDVWLSFKYASDKLSFGSYSKVNAFFQIASTLSIFGSKKPLHCSQCLLKQYTTKGKMISENVIFRSAKITYRNFNSFNSQQFSIFKDNYWISSGLSRPKKILSTTNKFPTILKSKKNKWKIEKVWLLRGQTCQSTMYLP